MVKIGFIKERITPTEIVPALTFSRLKQANKLRTIALTLHNILLREVKMLRR